MLYDLLVVGAGSAGCMAAMTASGRGLKVLLLDRKNEALVGEKVCGDALGSHHLDSLGISLPRKCAYRTCSGIEIFSPDQKTVFRLAAENLEAISLKRNAFGQFLLQRALSAGAEFVGDFHVSQPLFDDGFVAGVEGTGEHGQLSFRAKVVADCSGIASVIRKKVPDKNVSTGPQREDIMACYREIRKVVEKPPEYQQIYLDKEAAPGGYAWIFGLNEELVNVGLGVQMKAGSPNPRELFYRYIMPKKLLTGSILVNGGGGLVPTIRPLDSMVFNGLMVAGDSANAVNPMHGGGIGPSMISGKLLAEVCTEALSQGSVSTKALWKYNRLYMATYGAKQASLDVFRRFLQGITDEELNFGMYHKLVKPQDVLEASRVGDLRLSITEKAERALRAMGHLDFLMKLRRTANRMRALKRLYSAYPPFEELEDWITEVRAVESLV